MDRRPYTATLTIVCLLAAAILPAPVMAAGQYNFVYGDTSADRSASDYYSGVYGQPKNAPASTTQVVAATSAVGLVVGLCLWPVCGPLAAVIGPAVGFGLGHLLMSTYLCQSIRPRVAQFVGDAKAAVVGTGTKIRDGAVDLGGKATAAGSQAVGYVGTKSTELWNGARERLGGPTSVADLHKRRRQAYLDLQAAVTHSPPDLKRAQQLRDELAIIDRSLATGN